MVYTEKRTVHYTKLYLENSLKHFTLNTKKQQRTIQSIYKL